MTSRIAIFTLATAMFLQQIVMLSLAWKLGANQMGFFTLAEWLKGMTDLQYVYADKPVLVPRRFLTNHEIRLIML